MDYTKQHYIPQFLLKNFVDSDGRLSVYLIKENGFLSNQLPRNVAHMKNMYDLSKEDLEKALVFFKDLSSGSENKIVYSDVKFIEKYFSRVESSVNEIFDRILKTDLPFLTNDEKLIILIFLHDFAFRTKFYRDFRSTTYDKINNLLDSYKDNGLKVRDELVNSYQKNDNSVELASIFDVSSLVDFANTVLANYDFHYAVNEQCISFILSDNPTLNLHTGIKDFCFPISSKRAILLIKKNVNTTFIIRKQYKQLIQNLSYKDVHGYNLINAASSHEQIYGDKRTLKIISHCAIFSELE